MNYNDEPVEYCKACGKLGIIDFLGLPHCKDCGAINYTDKLHITEYLEYAKEINKDIQS